MNINQILRVSSVPLNVEDSFREVNFSNSCGKEWTISTLES